MNAARTVGVIFMSMLSMPFTLRAQNKNAETINWSNDIHLPPVSNEQQLGLAGVFAGISHDVLLIAGGSNFPGLKPWEGGKKVHYATIYALKKTADKFILLPVKGQLKTPVAYGACVTIHEGIICAGGETDIQNSSKSVFLIKWDTKNENVVFADLPHLPIPVANVCMSAIGKKIYLMGGESNGKPSAKAFFLDLAAEHLSWHALPDMPMAMSHSVAITQSNGKHSCIYVLGGRSSTPSGVSELHNRAFCFDPTQQKWTEIAPVSDGWHSTNLSAGTGVPFGNGEIMLMGGDKGDVFHRIEIYNAQIVTTKDLTEKQRLQAEKLNLITNHKGFSRDILVYNTLSNTWKKTGELPFYCPVTTVAVKYDGYIFIPCGEIKPGIRTPNVIVGKYETFK